MLKNSVPRQSARVQHGYLYIEILNGIATREMDARTGTPRGDGGGDPVFGASTSLGIRDQKKYL